MPVDPDQETILLNLATPTSRPPVLIISVAFHWRFAKRSLYSLDGVTKHRLDRVIVQVLPLCAAVQEIRLLGRALA